ncbi:MAG: hypothetical protein K0S25_649 [Bacillus sp. (in: firmicutes)]|jgi:hypothetical protein|nr:hypothetical protein [Bacillus sp. (in: firmicutes)]
MIEKRKLIRETPFSKVFGDSTGTYEYIDFKVAGTSFRQKEIKKAIREEKDMGLLDDPYQGMTNKEIKEITFDEPVFQYDGLTFSKCELKLEPDNDVDKKAIAVYVNEYKVGFVPLKGFKKGKDYLYEKLTMQTNMNFMVDLHGGKYKINRDDEHIETGQSDYKLSADVIITLK